MSKHCSVHLPFLLSTGIPGCNSLSVGHKVLKCHDNPAALARGGGLEGQRIKPLSSFIIQRQFSPRAGQFSPGPVCTGHTMESLLLQCFIHSLEYGNELSNQYRWLPGPGRLAEPPPGAGSRFFVASKKISDRIAASKAAYIVGNRHSFLKLGTRPGLSKKWKFWGTGARRKTPS